MALKVLREALKQTAVYWAPAAIDGYGSQTYGTAAEISVRWADKTQLVVNSQGQDEVSSAAVMVGQDVELEGYLYLGTEADLDSDHTDPTQIAAAKKIIRFEKTPTLTKRPVEYARMAYVK